MSKTSKIFCIQCNGLNVFMSKMLCTECNRLNGTHVEDVEDILYTM